MEVWVLIMACDVHTALFSSLIKGVTSLYTDPCTVCSYIRVEKNIYFNIPNLTLQQQLSW